MQPFVRAFVSLHMADLTMAMNPLRLGYTMFAERNPWMKGKPLLARRSTRMRNAGRIPRRPPG
jgi:hypothetical protein